MKKWSRSKLIKKYAQSSHQKRGYSAVQRKLLQVDKKTIKTQRSGQAHRVWPTTIWQEIPTFCQHTTQLNYCSSYRYNYHYLDSVSLKDPASKHFFVTFDCGSAIYARLTALITVEHFNNHDNDAVTLSYARKKVHRCNIYGALYYS